MLANGPLWAVHRLIISTLRHFLASGFYFPGSTLALLIFYLICTADKGGLLHLDVDNFVVVNFATRMA
jgi:hypothetical protein